MSQQFQQVQPPNYFTKIKPFLFGGFSGCVAATVIMPIDTWKVRIQIKSEDKGLHHSGKINLLEIAKDLYKSDGIAGFYRGLGSQLLRQMTYATTRLGLYKAYVDYIKKSEHRDLSFPEKIVASSISGFFGALVGNPADVCLVRFQSDTLVPENLRRNYKNVGDALLRISREEGISTLWRGSTPTIMRSISLTMAQLTTYDEIKQQSMRWAGRTKDTSFDRLIASTGAGVVASIMALPFDNVKTKLQKMKPEADGKFPYKGVIDCVGKTVSREGLLGLWVGLPVFYFRVAPQSMIILLVQDMLHSLFTHKH